MVAAEFAVIPYHGADAKPMARKTASVCRLTCPIWGGVEPSVDGGSSRQNRQQAQIEGNRFETSYL